MAAVVTPHFAVPEWANDPKRVDARLCQALEAVRVAGGVPITIHVAWDSAGHATNSYHYKGLAVDFHFSPSLSLPCQLSAILSVPEIVGIGWYPDWAHPGWHCDLRQGDRLFWIRRGANAYTYFHDVDSFCRASGAYDKPAAGRVSIPLYRPKPALASRGDLAGLAVSDLFARILWGECRGENRTEARGIAHVVRNRVNADLWHDRKPDWWGEGYQAVLLKDAQFSCVNEGNPNLPQILSLDPAKAPTGYAVCLEEAKAAMAGETADPTRGATGYHAIRMAKWPAWTKQARFLCEIGGHRFYEVS